VREDEGQQQLDRVYTYTSSHLCSTNESNCIIMV